MRTCLGTDVAARLRFSALYTSSFGETVALFATIVGIALLLVGIGLLVLTVSARRRSPDAAAAEPRTAVAT